MIPKDCKRLAEVDFPIAVVSKHALAEGGIRQGHPKILHLWWARRPLAACRAILLALLLPDPCDENCPDEFKQRARSFLPRVQGTVGPKDSDLQEALFKFIGDFANWNLSADRTYLEVSRGLVKAAHPEEIPLVVDPFAGGGSIPIEALRLGCDVFASDLNPVACLILKVLLEDIPYHGTQLSQALGKIGSEVKKVVEQQLCGFYPVEIDGSLPVAYLWARVVRCEQPNCGAEIPLFRSAWLSKKPHKKRALAYIVQRVRGKSPEINFTIFEPKNVNDVPPGTVKNGRATCIACNKVLPSLRVQAQLTAQAGGADNSRLLAVVLSGQERAGRDYRLPTTRDMEAVVQAHKTLQKKVNEGVLPPELSEPLSGIRPSPNARGVSAPTRYGATTFSNLFTARQRLALLTLAKTIAATNQSQPVQRLLALTLDKVAMQCNAHCRWKATGESLVDMFGRHAISYVWDFAESVPLGVSTGGWEPAINWIQKTVEVAGAKKVNRGQVANEDACKHPLPDNSTQVWFTDPPYYDNIPYSDLSDFFFVWLKRAMKDEGLISRCENGLTPKSSEAVWNRAHIINGKSKGPEFFEQAIAEACREGRRLLVDDGVGSIVFAHKTTEGWEALLSAVISGGWTITASWPIATEMATRLSARNSASLATSVHLICRPRLGDAPMGDWGKVHRELPKRVAEWIERLQAEHVRGADLVFACIGPALEIYSRYSKVVDAEDREIPLGGDPEATEPCKRGYLAYVWEAVGRAALEQVLGTAEASARNGAAGALEEDARLTALFLWTLQSTNGEQAIGNRQQATGEDEEDSDEEEEATSKGKKKKGLTLVFDVVRRFAQPLGIHLDNWEDRIIETEKGIVRLLPVGERGAQLFGQEGADLVAERLERSTATTFQLTLFPDKTEAAPKVKGKKAKVKKGTDKDLRTNLEATTLDRVHAAMLLQASGRTNGLRALVKAEQERGPDFLRLANALSALYPKESEEKRLLDAMLLAVPR